MAAAKLVRTQKVTDLTTGVIANQEIKAISFDITLQYDEEMTVGSKTYDKVGKSSRLNGNFRIDSIEDLEKAIADNPILSAPLTELLEKITQPYK